MECFLPKQYYELNPLPKKEFPVFSPIAKGTLDRLTQT